ncbi:MAG: DUF4886 domain-containing protein [Clostridia bacterium]|nr:DUF4886 domain-containing protein [Clostridia bacterium]
MKYLAIGNSFSVDSLEFLYDVLTSSGEKDVVLSVMYIGGCSLDMHAQNAEGDLPAYEQFINCSGEWECIPNRKLSDALSQGEWDVVSLQQQSGASGNPEKFGKLPSLIEYVKKFQPKAKLFWNMTWAYPTGSNVEFDFDRYGRDRNVMYRAITQTAQEFVLKNHSFDGFFPTGTAVENAWQTYGDGLYRDGLHLGYGVGRFLAAMTLGRVLTGRSPSFGRLPVGVTEEDVRVCSACVEHAVRNPFAVTEKEGV